MKMIKAFVRSRKVDEVIRALERAGCPGITVSRVHGVGYGYDPILFTLAPSELRKTPEVCKVEIACQDAEVDGLVKALMDAARTGSQGDGIVFVTPVEQVFRIRTGEEGSRVLDR